MKKTYFAILGAAAILSLATACSSKNVNEPTANESSQSASSESSSNGMDESSPMDDLKEDAKDAVLPSEGTADAKQSTWRSHKPSANRVGLVLPNPAQTGAFLVFTGFIACSQVCT